MSALGLLNFVVLQWFGVRLGRVAVVSKPDGYTIEAIALDQKSDATVAASPGASISWTVLRWVWPLTGWWSAYRWIARRP